jgi:O-antigen/teichoic acid export membrane protein
VMFGAWSNGVAFIPYGFIQARGRPHITAKVGLVEVIPYVLVLWLLITTLGLPGAAWAWTIRVTINCAALIWLSGCFNREVWRLAPAFLLMCAALAIARLLPMSDLVALGFAVPFGLCFAVLSYRLDPLLREVVLAAARRIGIVAQPVVTHSDIVS